MNRITPSKVTFEISSIKNNPHLYLLGYPKPNILKKFVSGSILLVHGLDTLKIQFLSCPFSNHNNHVAVFFQPFLCKLKKSTGTFKVKG
ncbi:unnamed protein product [Sphenostylis stenocarpa]|uniref:Uncharacterized protein n=1 Tax=Sphenostylis stenocarpa TaxID=92480 RepID=A0AA86SCX3_9FABA|nr:unnamed protein product [Sphenostylis stenocarpa]